PERETLANFGATGATLALHLSIGNLDRVVKELVPFYGEACPVAIVFRASWPDERVIRGTLATIQSALDPDIARTALIFVGPSIGGEDFDESRLYAADYDRRYRPQSTDSPWSEWRHGDD
ncbi:MAG: SAM-dependent methyltransferase, partial [Roseobacter sp.]